MLQKVSVPFVDESICEKSYEADGYAVTDGMICAGGVSGQDACQGDSGGIYEYIKYFGFYWNWREAPIQLSVEQLIPKFSKETSVVKLCNKMYQKLSPN